MTDAGLIAIMSFISPFIAERKLARGHGRRRLRGIFRRHPAEGLNDAMSGSLQEARAGALKNFTGSDSPYRHLRRRKSDYRRWRWMQHGQIPL